MARNKHLVLDEQVKLHIPLWWHGQKSIIPDNSFGNNDAVVIGATFSERGYYFDGIDDLLTVAHNSSLNLTEGFTLMCWIKPVDVMGPPQGIISKQNYELKEYDDEYIFQVNGLIGSWADSGALVAGTGPLGLAVYDGKLYCACYDNHKVECFDGTSWADSGALVAGTGPRGLAVYDGKLYCACVNHKVECFDGTSWADSGALVAGTGPLGLAVYDGKLYCACYDNHKVECFDGTSWADSGALVAGTGPRGLAVYDGKLYCACYTNHKVECFDGTSWADSGALVAGTGPRGLAVYDGKLYCACSNNHKVECFDGTSWADSGALVAGTGLRGLAVYDGKLYCACYTNHKVECFDGTSWADSGALVAGTGPRGLAVYDGKLYCVYHGNNKVETIGTGESIKTSRVTGWECVAVTYSANFLNIFQNGIKKTSTAHTLSLNNNTNDLWIGSGYGSSQSGYSGGNDEHYKGYMGEICLLQKELSVEEIRSYYELTRSRYGV